MFSPGGGSEPPRRRGGGGGSSKRPRRSGGGGTNTSTSRSDRDKAPAEQGTRWTPPWLTPDLSFSRNRSGGGQRRRRADDGSMRRSEPTMRRGSDTSAEYSDYDRRGGSERIGGGAYQRTSSSGCSVNSTSFGGGGTGTGGGMLGRRNPPMLTVILTRLESCLSEYCHQLATPTVPNAASAARVLDDSLYPPPSQPNLDSDDDDDTRALPPQPQSAKLSPSTSTPPRRSTTRSNRAAAQAASPPSSPLSTLGIWARKRIPSNLSSMSVSPYMTGAADYYSSRKGGGGNMIYGDPALESEWDRMVSPLTLLAGAEGLYGGLEHVAHIATASDESKAAAAATATQTTPSPPKTLQRKRSRIKRGNMRRDDPSLSPEPKSAAAALSSMSPSSLPPGAEKIWSMYGKVKKDLVIVKEILCDPILGSSSSMPQTPLLSPSNDNSRDEEGKQQQTLLIPPTHAAVRNINQSQQQPKSESQRAAESLARSISILTRICDARRDMISVHADLADESTAKNETRPTLFDLAKRCDSIMGGLPKGKDGKDNSSDDADCGATRAIVKAVRSEIIATAAALRTMAHLQTCSFFETVLHIKRLQVHLGPSSPFYSEPPCSLEMWLRHMLCGVLSLMSIYNDRVDAYASSTYGFQKHIMIEDKGQGLAKKSVAVAGGTSSPQGSPTSRGTNASHRNRQIDWYGPVHDLDTEVIELLHCHEERNGTAMAVALIFNTENCSGPTFERGFIFGKTPGVPPPVTSSESAPDASASTGAGEEETWPAIYLRTTIKSGDPDYEQSSSGTGNAGALLRRGGPRRGSKGVSMSSLSQLLSSGGEMMASQSFQGIKRPSYGGNTSRGSLISIASDGSIGLDGSDMSSLGPSPVVKASEYGYGPTNKSTPEIPSWPHTEMASLVTALRNDEGEVEGSLSPQQTNAVAVAHPGPFDSPRRPTLRNPFSPVLEEEAENASSEADSPVRSVTAASPRSPFSPPNTLTPAASAYHFVKVNETMWLAVMIRGEEDERRVRRKARGLTDAEIRVWLSQFAAKLMVSGLYCSRSVIDARKVSKGLALPTPSTSNPKEIGWMDSETNEYVANLKESFGMKPSTSPVTAPLKSPYIRKDSKIFGNSRRKAPEQQEDDASAASFFLGANLGRLLSS